MLAPNAEETDRDRPEMHTVNPVWGTVIRSFAFVRKEIVEIVRQPRLVLLLVVGPFVLLLLFGAGYAESELRLRTIFVGESGSVYDDVLRTYDDELDEYVDSQGLVETESEGRAALDDDRADVVVVFPADPAATVLDGERATITILHDEIDPIQEAAVRIAARLAIQEVNATVLTALATEAQDALAPAAELGDELESLAGVLGSGELVDPAELDARLGQISTVLTGSSTILGRLDASAGTGDLDELRAGVDELRERVTALDESTSESEITDVAEAAATIAGELDRVAVLPPEVLVRPFDSDTRNVLSVDIGATDYFTPAALALLLQHLALTFAALSLVRDRRTGLFELMRVGPLSSIEIIVGKCVAYLVVGAVVAAALIGAAVFVLGVPFAGSVAWVVVVVAAVLLASLALGMVLSLFSRTESQAVQFAMLALLAALFFSGFILSVDQLQYPVKVVSWILPVTYGIDAFQDIVLRGEAPDPWMLTGLGILIAAYGTVAVVGLRRRLRTTDG